MQKLFHEIVEVLEAAVHSLGEVSLAEGQVSKSVSFCDPQFGDLATNIALQLAAPLKSNPRELALSLAAKLEESASITSCKVAGPGFVNIRLSEDYYKRLRSAATESYCESTIGGGKKVNVEFISANPTGPLVLVNAWGGYYGDILASVFASQGYDVAREYYLNDGGNQIAQLGRAVQQAAGKKFTEEEAAELYRGEYVDKLAVEIQTEFGSVHNLQEAQPLEVGDKAKAIILETMIRPTLKRLGIHHDLIYPESTLDNQSTLERIREKGALKETDGALWLDGAKVDLDKDEVLVRSTDGQETYFLKDISYQLTKLEARGFDRAITIVGPDHHGQEKRLVAALDLLGAPGFVPLWTQTVRLIKDGGEFKMSKRKGNYIELNDFLDSVPSDTARFFFAMRDTNTHFDLDLNLVQAQNKHNPLYYVMYSYVRARSILSKASEDSSSESSAIEDGEKIMWRAMLELALTIHRATENYQVHSILYQVIELARLFHDWYEKHPIMSEDDVHKRTGRITLVSHYEQVMRGTLSLIGITPQERM